MTARKPGWWAPATPPAAAAIGYVSGFYAAASGASWWSVVPALAIWAVATAVLLWLFSGHPSSFEDGEDRCAWCDQPGPDHLYASCFEDGAS